MARWEIISGPREYKPGGGAAGHDLGWAYVIEHGNERVTVRVDRSASLAEPAEGSTEVVRRAVATSGRSAVEAILDRRTPPRRLRIETDRVTERAD